MSSGVWANWGISRKLENIATPMKKPVRFVAATGRERRTRRSISGSARVASKRVHASSSANPPPMSPTVRTEPQPQLLASVTASSTAASAADSSAAPAQSTCARPAVGLAGTSR